MIVLLGILAAAALAGLIFLFLSRKSTKIQKLAALGALVLSGLVLAVCGFVMVFGSGGEEEADPYAFLPLVEEAPPEAKTNYTGLLVFLALLLAFFGFIIFIGFRDQKKRKPEAQAAPAGGKDASILAASSLSFDKVSNDKVSNGGAPNDDSSFDSLSFDDEFE